MQVHWTFTKPKSISENFDDDAGNVWHLHATVTGVNVEVIQQVIQQWSHVFICCVATQTRLWNTSTYRIMCHRLHLFPYRIQICQSLSIFSLMHIRCLQMLFCGSWMLGNTWLSDKVFLLDSFVNKQCWQICWIKILPCYRIIIPTPCRPLPPCKVMAWAVISSKGFIGSFCRC